MIINVLVKNKHHPYIKAVLDKTSSNLLGFANQILGGNLKFGLDESDEDKYSSFLDITIDNVYNLQNLNEYIKVFEQILNEKFNIPSESILYKFKYDEFVTE